MIFNVAKLILCLLFAKIIEKGQFIMYELNITSGQEFNDYIIDKENGLFMPFNEAMIEGIPVFPPFSEGFIKKE